MRSDWRGVFFVSATELRPDESVDLAATQRLVEGLIDDGAHGIVVLGRFGEVIALTADERRRVVAAVVEVVGQRVPLLAGAIETNVDELARYCRDMERLGVDGLMATPLLGYPPQRHEALRFVRRLCSASALPIMLYNEPTGFGVDYTPEMLASLADLDTLIAIKESTAQTRRVTELALKVGDRYRVFCGQDDIILESLVLGADGWVCATGSAVAREAVYLFDCVQAGRLDEARAIYRWMYPLLHLDLRSTFIQCGKLALEMCGRGSERVRFPLLPLQGEERAEATGVVERLLATRPTLPQRSELRSAS